MWSAKTDCLFFSAAAARPLADAEDDKLGGLDRCQADLNNQLSGVAHFAWVKLGVAFYKERFFRRRAKQRAIAPHAREECNNRALDPLPQLEVVWLKHDPLRA